MMPGHRSTDAVVTICQNNTAKSIEIADVNEQGLNLLGYSADEIQGKPLNDILPPRIAELLKEYVEYSSDANDVGQVLSKVQSFSAIGKAGKEKAYRLKIVRADATDDNIQFDLILQDKSGIKKNEALRKAIHENFDGHKVLDEATGLPDRKSLIKDVELLGYYSNKSDMSSCFGIIQLDHYDELLSQYGREACHNIYKHISQLLMQSLRPDDVVGVCNYKRLGVLLIDTTLESARMTVNRLRWQIAANPFMLEDRTSVGLSVSIAFMRISGAMGGESPLEICEDVLEKMGPTAINVLTEVDENERRHSGGE